MMAMLKTIVLGIEIDEKRYQGSVVLLKELFKHCLSESLPPPRLGLVHESFREMRTAKGIFLLVAFDPRFGEECMRHIGDLLRSSPDTQYFVSSRKLHQLKKDYGFTNIKPLMVPMDQVVKENQEDDDGREASDTDVDDTDDIDEHNDMLNFANVPAVVKVTMSGGGDKFVMRVYEVIRSSSSSYKKVQSYFPINIIVHATNSTLSHSIPNNIFFPGRVITT